MQGRATGPANDAAAPEVKDRGKVQPAFGGLEVGDVSEPTLIGSGRRRPCGEEVGRDRLRMTANAVVGDATRHGRDAMARAPSWS